MRQHLYLFLICLTLAMMLASTSSAAEVTTSTATAPVTSTSAVTEESTDVSSAPPFATADTATLEDVIAADAIVPRPIRPYDTMIAISPTGKTLPAGQGRFNLDEIILQQFNYGITDRWQLGINITGPLTASLDLKYRFTPNDSPWQIALLAGGGSQLIGSPLAQYLFTRAAFSRDFAGGAMFNVTTGLYTGGTTNGYASGGPWGFFGNTIFSSAGSGTFNTFGWTQPINDRWEWVNDAGIVLRFASGLNENPPAGWITAFRYTAKSNRFAVQFGWAILLMRENLRDRVLGPPYIGLNWLL